MRIKELKIQGFKSFQKPVKISFPSGQSFIQLSGKNLVKPELGPNAVGKTSVFDAITWVFFGKTIRGVKGDAVCNWNKIEETKVIMKGSNKNIGAEGSPTNFKLTRTQNPNSIWLEQTVRGVLKRKRIHQDDLDNFLGFSYEAFTRIIVLGQFKTFFFDLSDIEKMKVFNDALKTEIWGLCQKRCSSKNKVNEEKVHDYDRKISVIDGEKKQLSRLTSINHETEIERLTKEEEAAHDLFDKAKFRIDVQKQRVKKIITTATVVEQQVRLAERIVLKADEVVRAHQNELTKFGTELRMLVAEKNSLIAEKESLVKLRKGVCPVCKTELTDEHIDHAGSEFNRLISKKKSLINSKKLHVDDAGVKLEKVKEDLEEKNKKLVALERNLIDEQNRLKEARNRQSEAELQESQSYRKMGGLALDIIGLKNASKAHVEEMKRLEDKQDDLRNMKNTIQQRIRKYEVMDQVFKQVRLWVIDSAIEELRVLTDIYMDQLGLRGWKSEFVVEREGSKKNSIIRGFRVFVIPPDAEGKRLPWQSFSGGESQRIKIAGECALSSMLRNRLGIDFPMECWDEPTQHLSTKGVDDLIEFFSLRSKKTGFQIWMVDHRSIVHGAFDRRYQIVLRDYGSCLRVV